MWSVCQFLDRASWPMWVIAYWHCLPKPYLRISVSLIIGNCCAIATKCLILLCFDCITKLMLFPVTYRSSHLLAAHLSQLTIPPRTVEQDPPLVLALPLPYFPLLPLSWPFFPPLFRSRNPLTPPLLFYPRSCKQGSGVCLRGKFFKSRWLRVKFDAFWGKIWPLNRRIVLGADSLKIGIILKL